MSQKTTSTATKLVVTAPVGTSGTTVDVVVKTAVGEVEAAQKWSCTAATPVDAAWSAATVVVPPTEPPTDPPVGG